MYKVGDRVWNKKKKCLDTVKQVMYESYVLESDIRFTVEEQDLHQTADSMFEELGFSKSPNSNELYIVVMDYVEFDLETKTYLTSINKLNNTYYTAFPENITPQLHQAIHQKLIELGWIG